MSLKSRCNQLKTAGFTLVEMAIVLVIIGLIVGAVIKGDQMLHNARVAKVITQLTEITTGISAFREKFFQLPGDMANARQRLEGCTPANNCDNGNGSGFIGNLDKGGGRVGGLLASQAGIDDPFELETVQFWKHLALAGMVSGVVTGAHPLDSLDWGITHPATPMTGGIHVTHEDGGLFLVYRDNMLGLIGHGGMVPCTGSWLCAFVPAGLPADGRWMFSPMAVNEIERKIDDANPNTGNIGAFGARPECRDPQSMARREDCSIIVRLAGY